MNNFEKWAWRRIKDACSSIPKDYKEYCEEKEHRFDGYFRNGGRVDTPEGRMLSAIAPYQVFRQHKCHDYSWEAIGVERNNLRKLITFRNWTPEDWTKHKSIGFTWWYYDSDMITYGQYDDLIRLKNSEQDFLANKIEYSDVYQGNHAIHNYCLKDSTFYYADNAVLAMLWPQWNFVRPEEVVEFYEDHEEIKDFFQNL